MLKACSVVALAATFLVAVASPADAGAECGPGHGDARIRKASKPYVGSGAFGCDVPFEQLVKKVTGPGDKSVFEMRVKNDSGSQSDMRVVALGIEGPTDFSVRIVRPDKGNKDVTNKVLFTGITYKSIDPDRSTPRLRLIVKGGPDVGPGEDVTVLFRAGLASEGSDFYDAVLAFAGEPDA